MTQSGKTTLAKRLINQYKNDGTLSIVLDPLSDPEWGASFVTANNDEFLKAMITSRSCALFVDESGAAIGRYAGAMQKVATQSRHWGHKAHFITQRVTQLDPLIRGQCSTLFLFRVTKRDALAMADEFGQDILKEAHTLAQGECFKVGHYSDPVRFKIF